MSADLGIKEWSAKPWGRFSRGAAIVSLSSGCLFGLMYAVAAETLSGRILAGITIGGFMARETLAIFFKPIRD